MAQARWTTPALALGAAAATLGAAVADMATGEHPTHLVVQVLAAALAFTLRGRAPVGPSAWRTAFVAAIAQPLTHAWTSIRSQPQGPHDHADLLHILATDGKSAIVQIGLPTVALLVLVAIACLIELLVHAVRRTPRGRPLPTLPPRRVPGVMRSRRGSLPRWCGWVISTARRGPPMLLSPAA